MSNVEAFVNAPRPENNKQLQSYLGAVNYYLPFISMLSDVTEPLTYLLHNNVQWNWSVACEKAICDLKHYLILPPVLSYFSANLPRVLT